LVPPQSSLPQSLIIAIDGPSGVGKGTVSREIARALGYRHIDTGAMYRAVAWKALRLDVPLDDEPAIGALAERARIEIEPATGDGQTGSTIRIDDDDVTAAIRTPEIDRAATAVARNPEVRRVLVARQRALGAGGGAVVEGRDIGSVVFPDADVKIYLDASPEERARRRAADPAHGGRGQGLIEVATALADRDRLDATRAVSPLMMAPGAVRIDTTDVPVEAVVQKVLDVVRRRSRA
jgi:CMP/dCMP kinase